MALKRKFLIGACVLLGVSTALPFFIFYVVYGGRMFPRVSLGDVPIGGLQFVAAGARIRSETTRFLSTPVEFALPDERGAIKALPRDLGISIDAEASARRAQSFGRSGKPFADWRERFAALFFGKTLSLVYRLDQDTLEGAYARMFAESEEPAQNYSYHIRRKGREWAFIPVSPRKGAVADRARITAALIHSAVMLSDGVRIPVTLKDDEPLVRTDVGGEAREEAERMLRSAPHLLIHEQGKWRVDSDTLGAWLAFFPHKDASGAYRLRAGIDRQSAEAFFLRIAAIVNLEPVNAQFKMQGDRVVAFVLSQDGISADIPETLRIFEENLRRGERTTRLAVKRKPPAITTEKIDTLGIRTLIGRGVSDFSGSPQNRVHNIKVGAARYNGILIKPGEEFSFNEHLGEISARGGYLPSLVIKKDKMVAEYGGGLCQVSTTAFRAAINAGLEITERRPHAFPVRYYDPQGFDASIYRPFLDLKFVNNTPGYVLIQTHIEGTKLIFDFFGTSDGRRVEMKGPVEYDRRANGALKAYFIRRIYKNGALIKEEKFSSNYKSPALYPIERNPLE